MILESNESLITSAIAATGHSGRRVSEGPAKGLIPDTNARTEFMKQVCR